VSQARLMLHGCVTSRCARPTGGRHGRTTRAPVQRRRAQSGDCYSELPRIPIPRTPVNKGKRKGRSPIRLAPSPLSFPFGGKALAPIHSRGPLAAALRRSSAGLLKRIRSRRRYTLNASPPKEIHLLAVGGDHIFRVGDHPIEAAAARDYVRGCGL
jgi:hypothetical protein